MQPDSDWTAGNFLDRNYARWFTIDVVSGNIYHINIDDKYGSGRHYAEGELFVYESEPTDVDAYYDYVNVSSIEFGDFLYKRVPARASARALLLSTIGARYLKARRVFFLFLHPSFLSSHRLLLVRSFENA